MEKEADKRKVAVKKSLSTQVAKLECFFWERNHRAEVGDFVVPIIRNRVGGLWKIVKISKLSGYRIYWYQPLKTLQRPRISQLRGEVEGLQDGFDIKVLDEKKFITKVVKSFGA